MTGNAHAARMKNGIEPGRISSQEATENFSDLHPPLDHHEALVASDRCYFCHDAPCVTACPTTIDIPLFIRQISTGNEIAAAKTIFDQNILGGMCARVCPTETLCEQACVREEAEGKPVQIGLLQRFATDAAMTQDKQFYERAEASGKSVAVVGAGPAGLACAHRLATLGHDVTIYEAKDKPGGLNEFGIAAYKSVDGFARHEVDYVLSIGGIEMAYGQSLGGNTSLDELSQKHDGVFLSIGLGGVNGLGLDGTDDETLSGVEDAVDFIARLRQQDHKEEIAIGRRVVVIGGGMTAVDAAVQAKLLGAEEVTICYRRGKENMNASPYEQDLASSKGVNLRHWLQPSGLIGEAGKLKAVEFEYTQGANGSLAGTGETMQIACDQLLIAIGQNLVGQHLEDAGLVLVGNRIKTDENGRTSMNGVWAGGDCTNIGEDLTVTAVAQGRDAAHDIHQSLTS